MNVFLIEALFSFFINNDNLNSNKHMFLKVEGCALIRGMGAYSRDGAYSIISPLGWALIRGGAYLRVVLIRGITVYLDKPMAVEAIP